MYSSLFALISLLMIAVFQINGTPAPGPDSQGRNLMQFGNMISETLSTTALNYNGYGCWCGFGGKGDPVDGTDACCKVHDHCYDDIINSRSSIFSCSPYISTYSWDKDPITKLPYCKNAPDSCTRRVCECDRAAVECYQQHAHTFNKSLKCDK